MPTEDKKLFWTVKEFAEIARVDRRAVSRGISNGEIPATRVGRQYRIPTTWIEQQSLAHKRDKSDES